MERSSGRDNVHEIKGDIPDYRNNNVKQTQTSLPPFVYDFNLNDNVAVHSKNAAKLENGAIFIGEWSDKSLRHGKGM